MHGDALCENVNRAVRQFTSVTRIATNVAAKFIARGKNKNTIELRSGGAACAATAIISMSLTKSVIGAGVPKGYDVPDERRRVFVLKRRSDG